MEKLPRALLIEKYESEFEIVDGQSSHRDILTFDEWKKKHNYTEDDKRLRYLKTRANGLYKEMTQALKNAEKEHLIFHSKSKAYAKVLKEIEEEIKT